MILRPNLSIYESVADYFRRMIHNGVLKEGDALPSVREVALAERINPNTVVRAYSLLAQEGLVVSIQKKGYFVSSTTRVDATLRKALEGLLASGYSISDIEETLKEIQGGGHDTY